LVPRHEDDRNCRCWVGLTMISNRLAQSNRWIATKACDEHEPK
jgi:hypothetical protein